MENAPRGLDIDQLHREMTETRGVINVHDLHVWTITSGLDCVSAHVVKERDIPSSDLLQVLRRVVREKFGIDHITIQIEPPDFGEDRPVI
jgi:cobalt-zinc-cadmium efflux system protein